MLLLRLEAVSRNDFRRCLHSLECLPSLVECASFPVKGRDGVQQFFIPVVSLVKIFALLALWNAFVIGSQPTVLDQAEQVGTDHNSHLTSFLFSAGVAPPPLSLLALENLPYRNSHLQHGHIKE